MTTTTSGRKRRILLAEDDDAQRVGLSEFLELSGYAVCAVASGVDMLEALAHMLDHRTPRPDLIITDIQMPGLNGLTVVEELRADGWAVPVIVMSAFGRRRLIAERLSELDDVEFVAKPFEPEALADLVYDLTC